MFHPIENRYETVNIVLNQNPMNGEVIYILTLISLLLQPFLIAMAMVHLLGPQPISPRYLSSFIELILFLLIYFIIVLLEGFLLSKLNISLSPITLLVVSILQLFLNILALLGWKNSASITTNSLVLDKFSRGEMMSLSLGALKFPSCIFLQKAFTALIMQCKCV